MATIRVSVAFDSERDAALLAWLEAQPNRSEAIREALAARAQGQPQSQAATLADVVRAIESLGERLAGVQVVTGAPAQAVEEDPELAAALDSLGI